MTDKNVVAVNTADRIKTPPISQRKDKNDDQYGRWNRDRHKGFPVGKFYNSPPMFFTEDHHPLWLTDQFRGRSIFLVLSGPSFSKLDKSKLAQPGIMTAGVNNSPKSFRPNLWFSVDSPDHFIRSIWLDPTIMKFVPICSTQKPLFHNDEWKWFRHLKVGDCPNMVYYRRNERFLSDQFLYEDTINWGCHKDYGSGRSIMLATMRMLFLLGFRRVFLLGCDMDMANGKEMNYHFEQKREKGSVRGNNFTYDRLRDEWFPALREKFEDENFFVYNCNPESRLRTFDFVSYDNAIDIVLDEWGNIDVENERTQGLYDEKKPPKSECVD